MVLKYYLGLGTYAREEGYSPEYGNTKTVRAKIKAKANLRVHCIYFADFFFFFFSNTYPGYVVMRAFLAT